ncbi:MAG: hypothetical protein LBV70_05585 [Candidatus Adiutrix sp.]|jgi:hypothetical protein|nr:hypothetical protein [Candidatus Adiutrix sp.]
MMEKVIEEIQFQVPMKDSTSSGDTVIFLREAENGQINISFARVMGFDPDLSKRDEWWHVRFVFLEIPPQARTIILQTPHFTGREVFTMGGRKVFIKAVNFEAFQDEGGGEAPVDGRGRTPKNQPPGKPTFTLIK